MVDYFMGQPDMIGVTDECIFYCPSNDGEEVGLMERPDTKGLVPVNGSVILSHDKESFTLLTGTTFKYEELVKAGKAQAGKDWNDLPTGLVKATKTTIKVKDVKAFMDQERVLYATGGFSPSYGEHEVIDLQTDFKYFVKLL